MVAESYNGWANYETWNVALWIQNDFNLYSIGCACSDYSEFLSYITEGVIMPQTPDGVYFQNVFVNYPELDQMISELA